MKNSKKTSKEQQETRSGVKDRLNIQALKDEMKQLREREHKLAERLVAEHGLVNELRKNPHFIDEADRESLAGLVDDVYNDFTSQAESPFPCADRG